MKKTAAYVAIISIMVAYMFFGNNANVFFKLQSVFIFCTAYLIKENLKGEYVNRVISNAFLALSLENILDEFLFDPLSFNYNEIISALVIVLIIIIYEKRNIKKHKDSCNHYGDFKGNKMGGC